jgi:Ca2+-binding EF-hand superfamily protein
MFFAAGAIGAAAIGALDLLSSLTPAKSAAAKTGVKQTNSIFDVTGASGSAQSATSVSAASSTATGALSPATFNALLSAQDANGKATPSDALKSLFAQVDGNGDSKITKAEFEDKLGAGGTNIAAANNVFNKMDANADGSVSLDEMATALKGKGDGHHAHHAHQAGGGADALKEALQGASSTTTANSDGSITTTLTYADGSKITLSQPASSATSTNASTQYNLVEKMMQRQTDALAASAKQSVSINI